MHACSPLCRASDDDLDKVCEEGSVKTGPSFLSLTGMHAHSYSLHTKSSDKVRATSEPAVIAEPFESARAGK